MGGREEPRKKIRLNERKKKTERAETKQMMVNKSTGCTSGKRRRKPITTTTNKKKKKTEEKRGKGGLKSGKKTDTKKTLFGKTERREGARRKTRLHT